MGQRPQSSVLPQPLGTVPQSVWSSAHVRHDVPPSVVEEPASPVPALPPVLAPPAPVEVTSVPAAPVEVWATDDPPVPSPPVAENWPPEHAATPIRRQTVATRKQRSHIILTAPLK
jgi:hypothetical protein